MSEDSFDTERLDELKEVKFVIPARLLLRLHSMKVLNRQSISESVARALEEYFQANPEPSDGSGAA
jgi:hypothetical protein